MLKSEWLRAYGTSQSHQFTGWTCDNDSWREGRPTPEIGAAIAIIESQVQSSPSPPSSPPLLGSSRMGCVVLKGRDVSCRLFVSSADLCRSRERACALHLCMCMRACHAWDAAQDEPQ